MSCIEFMAKTYLHPP